MSLAPEYLDTNDEERNPNIINEASDADN